MRRVAIIALVVGAIVALSLSIVSMSGDGSPRSATFPNAYLPADGGMKELRIVRSATAQAGPIEIDGQPCWLAYQCGNPACPGRDAAGTPVVFAYSANAGTGTTGPYAHCPRCAAKPGIDPTQVSPYLVDEALAEIRRP